MSEPNVPEMPAPGVRAQATRERILRVAEILFAEQGVAQAQMRDITLRAGQRNASAIHYHFGGRDGLLRELLAHHAMEIGRLRAAAVAGLEADPHPSLVALVRALVYPLGERLGSASGGCYLQILEQCGAGSPLLPPEPPSLQRLRELLAGALRWLPEDVLTRRLAFVGDAMVGALARRARARQAGEALQDSDGECLDELSEMLAGALSAPPPLRLG